MKQGLLAGRVEFPLKARVHQAWLFYVRQTKTGLRKKNGLSGHGP